METYEKLVLEVVLLDGNDIITDSTCTTHMPEICAGEDCDTDQ